MTSTYIDLSSVVHFTLAPRHEDEGETRPLISNAKWNFQSTFPFFESQHRRSDSPLNAFAHPMFANLLDSDPEISLSLSFLS